MAPESNILPPSAVWGHLTLRRTLGSGGAGQAYRAWDPELGHEVWLVVAPPAQGGPAARDLLYEARLLTKVRHPNLARVYGAERRQGRVGIWMEAVEGETLETTLVHAGRFNAREAALIGIDVCAAVSALHAAGVPMHDLTPSHVIRDRHGRIVVLPICVGLDASGRGGADDREAAVDDRPAGARAGRLDVAADVRRIGILLHRLVAGAPSADATVPLADLRSDLPLGYLRAVERALSPVPSERHPSAAAVGHALQTLWTPVAEPPTPMLSARNIRRVLAGAALAAGVVAVGMGVGAWLTRPAPPVEVRFDIHPVGDAVESLAMSRDGQRIAYTSGGRLLLRRLSDETPTTVGPTQGGVRTPFFSADGQWVYYFGGVSLWRVRASGGEPQPVASARRPSSGAAGPDGTVVYAVDSGSALMAIAPGGAPRVLRTQIAGVRTSLRWPSLPGDGSHVLYSAVDAQSGRRALYLGSVTARPDAVDPMVVAAEGNAVPSGEHVFTVVDGALTARRLDIGTARLVGEPVVLARGIGSDPYGEGEVDMAASAAGNLAYVAGLAVDRTLRVVDAAGRAETDLATGDIRDLRVSPQGTQVAYEQIDPATGGRDIWVVGLDGTVPRRISKHPGHDIAPTWSPDGSRLYYLSLRDARRVLMSAPPTGGAETRHFAFDAPALPQQVSADGRSLLYQEESQDTGWDLWTRPIDGGAPSPLVRTDASEQGPAVSPDGRWIAYSSPESQGRQVYVEPLPRDGRRWRVSAEHGRQPLWSADGTALYFHGHDRQLMRAAVARTGDAFTFAPPSTLFELPVRGFDLRHHYGVVRDGRFVVAVPPETMPPVPATVILNPTLP